LDINRIQSEDRLILFIAGKLDSVTAPCLEAELKKSLPKLSKLVLDLSALSDVSVEGINLIIDTHQQMSSQGKKFSLRHADRYIIDKLESAGVGGLITIE